MPVFSVRGPVALPVGASAMSLVLSDTDNSYLSKTWGASATLDTKATVAFFFKFVGAAPSGNRHFYDGGLYGSSFALIRNSSFQTNRMEYLSGDGSKITISTPGYTDTVWHHLTIALDSTQGTEADRVKIYVDGTEVSYAQQTALAQHASLHLTDNAVTSNIGIVGYAPTDIMDVKLAYFYLIDGQVLTPSSFTTGTGVGTTSPAAYGGTYGTNGFFLNFTGSATTDQSGQGNHWTQNNSPTFSSDVPT